MKRLADYMMENAKVKGSSDPVTIAEGDLFAMATMLDNLAEQIEKLNERVESLE